MVTNPSTERCGMLLTDLPAELLMLIFEFVLPNQVLDISKGSTRYPNIGNTPFSVIFGYVTQRLRRHWNDIYFCAMANPDTEMRRKLRERKGSVPQVSNIVYICATISSLADWTLILEERDLDVMSNAPLIDKEATYIATDPDPTPVFCNPQAIEIFVYEESYTKMPSRQRRWIRDAVALDRESGGAQYLLDALKDEEIQLRGLAAVCKPFLRMIDWSAVKRSKDRILAAFTPKSIDAESVRESADSILF